jgi:predicted CopG family antitoxin
VNWTQLASVSSSLVRPTTITVTERTRRLLESVKGQGESFDELLRELLEETYFDHEFYQEIECRWRTERRVPGTRVMRKAGLG